jgi:hypothetical protein
MHEGAPSPKCQLGLSFEVILKQIEEDKSVA